MARSEGLPLLQDPTTPRTKARELAQQQAATKRRRYLTIGAVVIAALLAVVLVATSRGGHRSLFDRDATAALAHTAPWADVVDAYRARRDFDGVVQVRVNGSVVYELAGGLADEEFAVPMALDSVFPVGSNSKLFVAVALYQLQERKLVNLSEPVNSFLNADDFASFGFPNQTSWCPRVRGAAPDSPCENITFVQLMHMGSGIGDSLNCDNVAPEFCHRTADNLGYYKGSLAPYIGIFINDPLVFKPDTNYSYANPNYYLLSYFVEKISGLRLEEYVQTMIADKIGLRDTYYDPYSGVLGVRRNYVQQYIHYYAQATPDADPATRQRLATGTCSPYMNSGAVSGSGGFRSTIADMQRWYTDLFDAQGAASKLLTQASVRMLVERVNPVNPTYGQGIGVGPARASDGWPSRLAYCGGMKCCTTCLGMLFPETRNETVLVGAFSNHMHYGFSDRAAFEAFRPTDFMGMDYNATPTFGDDGGAVDLRAALIDAYNNQTTRAP